MKIGQAAKQTGVSARTIRYYESVGLIEPAGRSAGGYREYGRKELHSLHFLRQARGLGFSVRACRELLSLYNDRNRASADVKTIARAHVNQIEKKIIELQEMRETLKTLIAKCHGDSKPDCPILAGLVGQEPAFRQE